VKQLGTKTFTALASSASAFCLMAGVASADQVFNDDVIVDGSLCVGLDCVNGESFGFDTLRLKENNTQLHFDDTSTSASFPNNDWRIIANDSANGGANFLAVQDSTAGRNPFRIEAGAPSNALVVEADGDIGIKTRDPVVDIHVVEGNTPTLRLEQDGSDGFTPQTYDVAANESNFFIRDVTNGSKLFFRSKPGAPENSIYIAADGDVGLSTSSPDAAMHVIGDALIVEDTDSNTAPNYALEVRNNVAPGNQTLMFLENTQGRPRLEMKGTGNTAQTGNWSISAGSTFVLQDRTNGDNEMIIDQSGNMTIKGTLTENSDKTTKMAIEPVNPSEILAKVAALQVSEWTYKNDAALGTRHIGPMAQDFYALFGTGASERGISTMDTSGVALAAIRALAEENAALKARLDALETKVAD